GTILSRRPPKVNKYRKSLLYCFVGRAEPPLRSRDRAGPLCVSVSPRTLDPHASRRIRASAGPEPLGDGLAVRRIPSSGERKASGRAPSFERRLPRRALSLTCARSTVLAEVALVSCGLAGWRSSHRHRPHDGAPPTHGLRASG